MRTRCLCLLFVLATVFIPLLGLMHARVEKTSLEPQTLVRVAVRELVKMQEVPGQWPYVVGYEESREQGKGFARVDDGLPVAYRIAGTSLVSQALMFAAPDDPNARAAVQRALSFVLKLLRHPSTMVPNIYYSFDTRVWGHTFALQFLCQVRARKIAGEHEKEVQEWIPLLEKALIEEQLPDGGWSYSVKAMGKHSLSFVTALVTQSLLLARSQGEKIPDELFTNARKALESARLKEGAFAYVGSKSPIVSFDSLPGSAARSTVCETTLVLLGGGSTDAVRSALNNFHENWEHLEARRQKGGTYHEGPYNIAPYYYCFGHRYAAQAIQMLPEKERAKERERLLKLILKTQDADGTWNDLTFPRSRSYGTAMMVLALLGDKTPLPPKFAKQ